MKEFVFVGNHLTGKSTLLNSLIGTSYFHSGFNALQYLTKTVRSVTINGAKYTDTPPIYYGMSVDKNMRMVVQHFQAMVNNPTSVTQLVLVFVIDYRDGELYSDDHDAVQSIIGELTILGVSVGENFCVIANRASDDLYDDQYVTPQEDLAAKFMENGVEVPPNHIMFVPFESLLDKNEDMLHPDRSWTASVRNGPTINFHGQLLFSDSTAGSSLSESSSSFSSRTASNTARNTKRTNTDIPAELSDNFELSRETRGTDFAAELNDNIELFGEARELREEMRQLLQRASTAEREVEEVNEKRNRLLSEITRLHLEIRDAELEVQLAEQEKNDCEGQLSMLRPALQSYIEEAKRKKEEEEDVACAICLENVDDSDRDQLPCGHTFHTECIEEWLSRRQFCPLCKADVDMD